MTIKYNTFTTEKLTNDIIKYTNGQPNKNERVLSYAGANE